jgi:hypothetical protein
MCADIEIHSVLIALMTYDWRFLKKLLMLSIVYYYIYIPYPLSENKTISEVTFCQFLRSNNLEHIYYTGTLQLESVRRNLKRAQFNLHGELAFLLSLRGRQLLLIVLENVRLPDIFDGQAGMDGPAALATKRLVYTEDDAPATTLRKLAARDVLVILATLDGVEDEGFCPTQIDGFEDVSVLVARHRLNGQGMIEVVSGPHGAVVKRSRVRQDGVTDTMTTHVSVSVGSLRGPQK